MPVLNLFNGNVFGGTLVVKSVPDFIKIKFRNKDEHRALVRRCEIIFCYFKFIPGLSWIYWLNLHSVTATEVNFIGDCVAGTYCGGKREPGFSSPTRTITLEKPQVHTFFSLPPLRKPELFSSSYTSQSRLSCLLSELVVDGASPLNQRSIQGTHRWLVELWRFWKIWSALWTTDFSLLHKSNMAIIVNQAWQKVISKNRYTNLNVPTDDSLN